MQGKIEKDSKKAKDELEPTGPPGPWWKVA